jgi:CIC family chloride channel protein
MFPSSAADVVRDVRLHPLFREAAVLARRLRNRARANQIWLLAVAIGVGFASGFAAHVLSLLTSQLHRLLYAVPAGMTLTALHRIAPPWRLLWLPAGGAVLGGVGWLWLRRRPGPIVDPVEANALRGGRMSLSDSLFLGLQTLISNGCGASVGLEAAYAQLGSGAASSVGLALNLRRNDLRVLVGAGAGAAIAAAFGAPLTGAFYAFELIIGSYTVAAVAPVVGAALAGYVASQWLGGVAHIADPTFTALAPEDYVFCAGLGLLAALTSVGLMRLVSAVEAQVKAVKLPRWCQPILGGAIVAGLGLITPEVLSAGHGALESHLVRPFEPGPTAVVFGLKILAAVVCLGLGFRGGLFFASLFLGALLGQLYWWAVTSLGIGPAPDMLVSALVGMGAMAAGVIGGPLTMTFLVLETTGDFGLSGATLASALVCTLIVRETFGYSFSTWRLHLRGESVRSAHDVGRLRALTVGRLMRNDPPIAERSITVAEFKRRFPLGSTQRVVLVDSAKRYGGMVLTPEVYAGDRESGSPVADLARCLNDSLNQDMTADEAIARFDAAGADELAVVDASGQVLGLLTESYTTRRFAEELEKTRRDLTGEALA